MPLGRGVEAWVPLEQPRVEATAPTRREGDDVDPRAKIGPADPTAPASHDWVRVILAASPIPWLSAACVMKELRISQPQIR